MIDRKLLELAAKAAGYDTAHQWNAHRLTLDPPVVGLCIPDVSTCWNPLDDDSDALRLAVKLRIDISHMAMEVFAAKGPQLCVVEPNDDPYAATRRAIVRAAAVIGKVK